MAITNVSKPTTSLSNSSKVSIGETWATITTTWATETRTWLAVSQLITNTSRYFNQIWLATLQPWLMLTPWLGDSEITNQSRP